MKTLIFILLSITLLSCEKEDYNPSGEKYRGNITLTFSDTTFQTVAIREFSDNGQGTYKIHWWDVPQIPPVDCYTIIKGNEYIICSVVIASEVTCNGIKRKDEFVYRGKGVFQGDSLIESGTVKWILNAGNPGYREIEGEWLARLKRVS